MTLAWQAGAWGLFSGSALLIGAAFGFFFRLSERLIAAVMAFGSGVLISALSFELMDTARKQGGIFSTGLGFLAGAVIYTAANFGLAKRGAQHRKRSNQEQPSENEAPGSGMAIALGALLDGIPESIVIGVSLISGLGVEKVTVAAIFLSNLPEGLSSAAGMRQAGRSLGYVFGVWGGIALLSGLAALSGYAVFSHFSPAVIAASTALAAGAILCMLVDTMIPEAFAKSHLSAGLIAALGFLSAFALANLE